MALKAGEVPRLARDHLDRQCAAMTDADSDALDPLLAPGFTLTHQDDRLGVEGLRCERSVASTW
ncbi:hypothetical protein GCM10009623_20350 [Nocardioides aestuarii]